MTEREIDIADMQCWVFRIAQTRWHISPIECAELFKKYDILGYISECYDLLCTYSYYHVVDDAELILASHNVFINEEELFRRHGIIEDDLVGFDDVEIE